MHSGSRCCRSEALPSELPSYARSLNEQQRRAALAPIDAPLLVLAGAGSGKTGVMAARVQHILASGVPPASVLALTFTRAAETAIRERLTASVGVRVAKALRVATFHSLALSICRPGPRRPHRQQAHGRPTEASVAPLS